jgi:hypothetical protein
MRHMGKGYHVWHFVGHGAFSIAEEVGRLLFENDAGTGEELEADEICLRLGGSALRLVVLNACQSGLISSAPFRGLASALIQLGVPTVVGMQSEIPIDAAHEFAHAFYEALTENNAFDMCVTRGRTKIAVKTGHARRDWSIPVVYSCDPDSGLFPPIEVARKLQLPAELSHTKLSGKVMAYLAQADIHQLTVGMIAAALLRSSFDRWDSQDSADPGETHYQEFVAALGSPVSADTRRTDLDTLRGEYAILLDKLQRDQPPPEPPVSKNYTDSYDDTLFRLTETLMRFPQQEGADKCLEIVRAIPATSRDRLFVALTTIAPAIRTFHPSVVGELIEITRQIIEMYP